MLKTVKWRITAITIASIYFSTNVVLAYSSEKQFWSDRRRAAQNSREKRNPGPMLALANVSAQLLDQMPVSMKASPSLSEKFSKNLPLAVTVPHPRLFDALQTTQGTIRKVWIPKKNVGQRVVVHIQDVHQNEGAQRNIGNAIESLLKTGEVGVVGLEGSWGPLNLKAYHDFKDRQVIQTAADYLLRKNRITGPVHAAMTTAAPLAPMTGVDDPIHYKANVDAYRASFSLLDQNKNALTIKIRDLSEDKIGKISKELQNFDSAVETYHAQSKGLMEYVQALAPDKTKGNAGLLAQAFEMENKLDFTQVEKNREELINTLVKELTQSQMNELVQQTAAYRQGILRYGQFYTYLKELCRHAKVDLSHYPQMDAYIQYVLLSDRIDSEKLLEELAELEKARYASLAKTEQEKKLVERTQALRLTGQLLRFELTTEDWRNYLSSEAGRSLGMDVTSFESFYREAHARDGSMAANLLRAMDVGHHNTAVLVTGGYHASGISEALTQAGVTVVTFTPRIEKIDTENGSAYLSVFTQEKTPLEKLFAGEKLFLGIDAFDETVRQLEGPAAVALAEGTSRESTPKKMEKSYYSVNGKGEIIARIKSKGVATIRVQIKEIKKFAVELIGERDNPEHLMIRQKLVTVSAIALAVSSIRIFWFDIISLTQNTLAPFYLSLSNTNLSALIDMNPFTPHIVIVAGIVFLMTLVVVQWNREPLQPARTNLLSRQQGKISPILLLALLALGFLTFHIGQAIYSGHFPALLGGGSTPPLPSIKELPPLIMGSGLHLILPSLLYIVGSSLNFPIFLIFGLAGLIILNHVVSGGEKNRSLNFLKDIVLILGAIFLLFSYAVADSGQTYETPEEIITFFLLGLVPIALVLKLLTIKTQRIAQFTKNKTIIALLGICYILLFLSYPITMGHLMHESFFISSVYLTYKFFSWELMRSRMRGKVISFPIFLLATMLFAPFANLASHLFLGIGFFPNKIQIVLSWLMVSSGIALIWFALWVVFAYWKIYFLDRRVKKTAKKNKDPKHLFAVTDSRKNPTDPVFNFKFNPLNTIEASDPIAFQNEARSVVTRHPVVITDPDFDHLTPLFDAISETLAQDGTLHLVLKWEVKDKVPLLNEIAGKLSSQGLNLDMEASRVIHSRVRWFFSYLFPSATYVEIVATKGLPNNRAKKDRVNPLAFIPLFIAFFILGGIVVILFLGPKILMVFLPSVIGFESMRTLLILLGTPILAFPLIQTAKEGFQDVAKILEEANSRNGLLNILPPATPVAAETVFGRTTYQRPEYVDRISQRTLGFRGLPYRMGMKIAVVWLKGRNQTLRSLLSGEASVVDAVIGRPAEEIPGVQSSSTSMIMEVRSLEDLPAQISSYKETIDRLEEARRPRLFLTPGPGLSSEMVSSTVGSSLPGIFVVNFPTPGEGQLTATGYLSGLETTFRQANTPESTQIMFVNNPSVIDISSIVPAILSGIRKKIAEELLAAQNKPTYVLQDIIKSFQAYLNTLDEA